MQLLIESEIMKLGMVAPVKKSSLQSSANFINDKNTINIHHSRQIIFEKIAKKESKSGSI